MMTLTNRSHNRSRRGRSQQLDISAYNAHLARPVSEPTNPAPLQSRDARQAQGLKLCQPAQQRLDGVQREADTIGEVEVLERRCVFCEEECGLVGQLGQACGGESRESREGREGKHGEICQTRHDWNP